MGIEAAVEVAGLLRSGAPPRLFTLLGQWRPPQPGDMGRDAEALRRVQLLWLQQHCAREWLQPLATLVLANQPLPGWPHPAGGAAVSVPDAAEAFGLLCRFVQTGNHGSGIPTLAGQLQTGLVRPCEVWLDQTRLSLEATTEPDMAALAVGVLRVEAVLWTLSLARLPGAAVLEPKLSRLVRDAIRAADRTLKAFLADPTLFSLFDAVTVMSRVDELLTLLARLTEQQQMDDGPPALSIDAGVQAEFLGTLEGVSRQLCARLRTWLRNDEMSSRLFGSVLLQLSCLHRLACALNQPSIPCQVDATLLQLIGMAEQIIQAERRAGRWTADAPLLIHTEQLADLAAQVGRGELVPLLRQLREVV